MTNHYKFFLIFLLILIGCSPYSELNKDFKNVVYFNGINEFEAKTIAEKALVMSEFKSYYKTFPTKIRNDEEVQKYPDYYFVDFSPSIAADAPSFLVVINKNDGEVLLAQEYWPYKRKSLDWVF